MAVPAHNGLAMENNPQTKRSDIVVLPVEKIIKWLEAELKEEGRGNLGRVCIYQSIIYHLEKPCS